MVDKSDAGPVLKDLAEDEITKAMMLTSPRSPRRRSAKRW
jgi:hypothetical protein